MSQSAPASGGDRRTIAAVLDGFVGRFNDNDLDGVLSFFADDAVYHPGDGRIFRGGAAIREAFRPQFQGAYGQMFFALEDRVVDETARKAAIRWICHHDLRGPRGHQIPFFQRLLYRALYGARFGWHGMDVFHFDGKGRITAKHTYANYHRPQIRRDLAATAR